MATAVGEREGPHIVEKTKGNENDAELMTKIQPNNTLRGHLARMCFEPSDREGHR